MVVEEILAACIVANRDRRNQRITAFSPEN